MIRMGIPVALPEECVSLREALQAHTINTAYQAHLEDITGSIEVGKSAELLVLDSDIETIPSRSDPIHQGPRNRVYGQNGIQKTWGLNTNNQDPSHMISCFISSTPSSAP